jgi:BASS family bile acid:Na+ symporter
MMQKRSLLLFFTLATLSSGYFYLEPDAAHTLKGWIVPLLGIIMFSMGATLEFDAFKDILRRPGAVLLGVLLQFLFMPLIAFLLLEAIAMPPEIAIGMILVGASPGGTASNLITYLAKGNTALSVTMTSFSTLASFVMTPFLVWLYLDKAIDLNVTAMVLSVLKIVIIPVLLGMVSAKLLGQGRRIFESAAPPLSMGAIALIIGIIVGVNHDNFQNIFGTLLLAVVLHNGIGLSLGYGFARLAGFDSVTARTVAIEVGMQNSALAVVLATKFFTPAAALAGALFSVWHNISGMIGSYLWNRHKTDL